MATAIDSYLNAYLSPYAMNAGSAGSVFNYGSVSGTAKQQAKDMLADYKSNQASVKTLKNDTAKFLDQYTLSMKTLDQSAEKVRLGGLDKLLYDGEGQVTDATVEKTVKAYQEMVDNYNSSIKLLNDNADRGPGTMKQLGRMVADPAPAEGMKMVGVTVNKDGTLALDAEKMTAALKTEDANQRKLYTDIMGGWGGIADNVHKNAMFGANTSARDLVMNDIANIQQAQAENPFKVMYDSFKGNVFSMNNQSVTGMLMNFMV